MNKLDWKDRRNLTMLADYYEFTMANGFLENGLGEKITYFDMYFRAIPDDGGFAIMAGVDQVIEYLKNLHFTEEDIAYFKSKNLFGDKFLDFLKNFEFTCDVWAIPEGTPIFPQEPLIIVKGPVVQAQLVETMILLTINHQSLIATKANRIVRAAKGRPVMEFGSRRAQGYEAAILGARAAYIGGCVGSANTIVDRDFDVPALGTMAHSWVQMFDTELEAFNAYARIYPDSCVLLVDTYNTLRSGVPNAIKCFNEVILPAGFRPKGIRLDSGDIAYLSKEARKMLDAAGFSDVKITASSGLDEYIIRDLLNQGASVDIFGVGERLITAKSAPIFGGVYKLVAVEEEDGQVTPKIKLSENVGKITTPGFKQIHRLYDRTTKKAIADVVTLHDEEIDDTKPYEIFHPLYTWKRKTVEDFYSRKLLVQIFDKGLNIYQSPDVHEIKDYCLEQIDLLWDEVKRFEKPHEYIVDLSLNLWSIKDNLLKNHNGK